MSEQDERRIMSRRESDCDFTKCPHYEHHSEWEEVKKDLHAIKKATDEMREIITAWDDAKGFVKTVRILGEVAKWIVATAAAVGIIFYWVRK